MKYDDPRYQGIVDFYYLNSQRLYGCCVFDGSDGKALKVLLSNHKQFSLDDLLDYLSKAFVISHSKELGYRLLPGFRLREFVSQFPKIVARFKTRPKSYQPDEEEKKAYADLKEHLRKNRRGRPE